MRTGSARAPRAAITALPRVGNGAFAIGTLRSTTTGSGILWLGTSNLASPVRILGVDLWLDPTRPNLQVPIPGGPLAFARAPLPIPANNSLRNLLLFTQTVWAEPTCATPLFASDGLGFVITP